MVKILILSIINDKTKEIVAFVVYIRKLFACMNGVCGIYPLTRYTGKKKGKVWSYHLF